MSVMSPNRVLAALVAVVVGLAAALVLLGVHDPRPRAAVGEVLDHPFQEDDLPHRGEVLLPWARLEVGASPATDELPDLLGAEANLRAPDGGSFVRVAVDLPEDFGIPLAAVAAPYVEEIEVVLRADGRDYVVDGPGGMVLDPNGPLGQGGSRWVAVAGHPEDLEVRVSVDGVTQTVDAADGSVSTDREPVVAALAALPTDDELVEADDTPCGPPRREDTTGLVVAYRPALACHVSLALRTPYVDGLGWAEDGREYAVVQLVRPRDLSFDSPRGEPAGRWSSDLTLTARLAGGTPLAPEVDVNSLSVGGFQDVDNPSQLVFDVAAGQPLGDLVLEVDAAAELGAPWVTDRRDVRLVWTVALQEVS